MCYVVFLLFLIIELLLLLHQLYSDISFIHPFYKSVHSYLKLTDPKKSTLYLYQFNFKGPISYSRLFTRTTIDFGVVHLDDTIYLFRSEYFPKFAPHSPWAEATRTLIRFYTDFARTGAPTPLASVQPCTFKETHMAKEFCSYYEFSNGPEDCMVMKGTNAFDTDVMEFWKEILKTVIKNRDYEF